MEAWNNGSWTSGKYYLDFAPKLQGAIWMSIYALPKKKKIKLN